MPLSTVLLIVAMRPGTPVVTPTQVADVMVAWATPVLKSAAVAVVSHKSVAQASEVKPLGSMLSGMQMLSCVGTVPVICKRQMRLLRVRPACAPTVMLAVPVALWPLSPMIVKERSVARAVAPVVGLITLADEGMA
jgi:hypothetical protein